MASRFHPFTRAARAQEAVAEDPFAESDEIRGAREHPTSTTVGTDEWSFVLQAYQGQYREEAGLTSRRHPM